MHLSPFDHNAGRFCENRVKSRTNVGSRSHQAPASIHETAPRVRSSLLRCASFACAHQPVKQTHQYSGAESVTNWTQVACCNSGSEEGTGISTDTTASRDKHIACTTKSRPGRT